MKISPYFDILILEDIWRMFQISLYISWKSMGWKNNNKNTNWPYWCPL